MTETAAARVRFRDLKPYDAPASLDELRGPATGMVTLPLRLRWVPGERTYDVGETGGARVVYQAVLAEGAVADQRRFLNRERLIGLWPDLNLDQRVVRLWEGRFPQLRGLAWPASL
ncbi:MAG: transcriptional regulator [Propionibacteriaceae bacterium]|jgi:hypothetical protein|nr:transcriptional regulator [Propionibacteriaceae bacterium]